MATFGILAFVVALLVSVMLHEAGHFLTARAFGMKATQFFIGFGPTLFSRKRGETEYGVKAIPAGGFVKIVGMTPLEDVEPGDEERVFYKHPAGRKTVVLAAGSAVHFLICVLLIFGAIVAFGVPNQKTSVLYAPTPCMPLSLTVGKPSPPAEKDKSGHCAPGTVPGVAAAAGIKQGDKVVRAGGRKVTTFTDLTSVIRANAGRELELVVERNGSTRTLHVKPILTTRPSLEDDEKSEQVGAIGVGPDLDHLEHIGAVAAVKQTGTTMKLLVIGTYESLTKKLHTITKVYDKDRDSSGFVGVVGVSRVSGEVFNDRSVPFTFRLMNFLFIVAGLNLFVGIFNLLPLLPLDGGHIAVVFFETVRDKVRRARGYVGEIQRVDYNRLMPLTLGVIVLFVGFTVWLLGADIVNPIRLSQ